MTTLGPFSIMEEWHLIESNRIKLAETVAKDKLRSGELIDAFISLHLVLESGLHAFFRRLSDLCMHPGVEMGKLYEQLDNVDLVGKVAVLLYGPWLKFEVVEVQNPNFSSDSILERLKTIRKMRNLLVHGRAIGWVVEDGKKTLSPAAKGLTKDSLVTQVAHFKYILQGVAWYAEHINLINDIQEMKLKDYIKECLDTEFLDKK